MLFYDSEWCSDHNGLLILKAGWGKRWINTFPTGISEVNIIKPKGIETQLSDQQFGAIIYYNYPNIQIYSIWY